MTAIIDMQTEFQARPKPIILTAEERLTAKEKSLQAIARHEARKALYDYFIYNKNSYKRIKGLVKYIENRIQKVEDDKNIMAGVRT